DPGGTAYGRSDEARTVGAECRAHDAFLAIERPSQGPAGLGIPQSSRLVPGRREDALAVAAECGAVQAIGVADERLADRLAGLGVPQPRGLVARGGHDALAVGAERRDPH